MRTGTPGFVGSRLREARDIRGLTAISLAELTGVSRQAISQYENGKASPSQDVVSALAIILRVPPQFFLRAERKPEPGTIFFRSMSSTTKGARARAEGRLHWLHDIAKFLSQYVELPTSNVPSLGLAAEPLLLSDDDIEAAAEEVRRYWGLRDGPIGNMVRLLENNGAVIGRDELGAETLDGLSKFTEGRPYVIVGTDKGTPVRWRFDAAHELGHLVLHAEVKRERLLKPGEFKRIEEQAHRFAAAFLLPMAPFANDFFAPNLDVLRALKPKWNVSISMMIIRARHAGLLSEQTERSLWVNVARRGWRRNEPYDDSMQPEEPRLLRRAFEVLLNEAGLTPDEIVAGLALPASDIESLIGLHRGYFDETCVPIVLKTPHHGSANQNDNEGQAEVIRLPFRPRTS